MTQSELLRIDHRRLGPFEIPASRVLHFEGLPGFPEARRLALLGHDRVSAFAWLACLDDPDLAFVVGDPKGLFPDYTPRVEARHLQAIGANRVEDLEILVILTVRPGHVTANLAAPILVNPQSRQALQALLDDDRHSTREPLPSAEFPAASARPRLPQAAQIESKPHR